uniref:Putative anti-platelet-like protein n=1 Tax=Haementeria vizottoi TaxID=1628691 RepID=A0A0P4VV34_9ANNE
MSSFLFYLLCSALLVVPSIRAQEEEEEEGGEEEGEENTPAENDEPSPPSSADIGDEGPSKTEDGSCWSKREDLSFDESLLTDAETSSIAECKDKCYKTNCAVIQVNNSNKKCFYLKGDADWGNVKQPTTGYTQFHLHGCE